MTALFDAAWRAAAYCLHPRVVLWSLIPLALGAGLVFGLGWLYWETSVAGVRAALERWELLGALLQWLEGIGAPAFRAVLAPLLVVALAVPAIVLASLLLVAWTMAPAMAALVARRRFADLARAPHAPGVWAALGWSLLCTLVAGVCLVLSIPLWFMPPLVLLVPPLIWGWLAYRVMSHSALARHADAHERHLLLRRHRWPLRTAGLVCGYLGTAPSLVWTAGAATLVVAPLLLLAAVWLYTLVFTFASLWFAHYLLDALRRQRLAADREAAELAAVVLAAPSDPPALQGPQTP